MFIVDKIKEYFGLLDDIAVDFLKDIKSLRYQLVLWAFVLNGYVLYLIQTGKADYKLAAVSIALLTAVYAFFFTSKSKQAEIERADLSSSIGEDPMTERDPDAL